MNTKGHVYLRINTHYTATIRTLDNLHDYLDSLEVDSCFGEIVESSNVSKDFIREVKAVVSAKKEQMNKQYLNKSLLVWRNQGYRHAKVVAVNGRHLLIEYVMPNGTSSLNTIEDFNEENKYKTISYRKASTQFDLNLDLLINHPQK